MRVYWWHWIIARSMKTHSNAEEASNFVQEGFQNFVIHLVHFGVESFFFSQIPCIYSHSSAVLHSRYSTWHCQFCLAAFAMLVSRVPWGVSIVVLSLSMAGLFKIYGTQGIHDLDLEDPLPNTAPADVAIVLGYRLRK